MTPLIRWQGKTGHGFKAVVSKKIEAVLLEHGLNEAVELEISLVGKKEIQDLNKRFRGKNEVTDVLSFPLEKEVGPDMVTRLGAIVVCPDKAEGQSLEFLILHGVNHLLGIHH